MVRSSVGAVDGLMQREPRVGSTTSGSVYESQLEPCNLAIRLAGSRALQQWLLAHLHSANASITRC